MELTITLSDLCFARSYCSTSTYDIIILYPSSVLRANLHGSSAGRPLNGTFSITFLTLCCSHMGFLLKSQFLGKKTWKWTQISGLPERIQPGASDFMLSTERVASFEMYLVTVLWMRSYLFVNLYVFSFIDFYKRCSWHAWLWYWTLLRFHKELTISSDEKPAPWYSFLRHVTQNFFLFRYFLSTKFGVFSSFNQSSFSSTWNKYSHQTRLSGAHMSGPNDGECNLTPIFSRPTMVILFSIFLPWLAKYCSLVSVGMSLDMNIFVTLVTDRASLNLREVHSSTSRQWQLWRGFLLLSERNQIFAWFDTDHDFSQIHWRLLTRQSRSLCPPDSLRFPAKFS